MYTANIIKHSHTAFCMNSAIISLEEIPRSGVAGSQADCELDL